MKRFLIILLLMIVIVGGCESLQLVGFSVGATYLTANVETTSVNALDGFGQMTTKETTKVDGVLPIFLLNFKFK